MIQNKKSFILISSALVLLAIVAYFGATTMVDAIYAYRSPLSLNPPQSAEATVSSPATEKVVMVLVDALRLDTSLDPEVMPTLSQLRKAGASAIMHSQTPSFSSPGYSTIFTGAYPYLNDGPAFNLDYEDIPTWTQENLFTNAHRAGMDTAISAYNWFEKLVPQSAVTHSFYTPGEDRQADVEVMQAALPWLDDRDTKLILIHLDQVDYAGHHEGGATGDNWKAAARRVDQLVAEVLDHMNLEEETLLVFSDHGQIDAGGHGGGEQIVLVEPFIIAGKGVKPGTYPDMEMVDIAPTVSALLGVSIPATTQGNPLFDLLDIDKTTRNQYGTRIDAIHAELAARYQAAIGLELPVVENASAADIRDLRLMQDRWQRSVIGIGYLLAVGLILFKVRKSLPALISGAMAYLAVFNLKYLVIDKSAYSFSAIIDPTSLIVAIAINTLLALVFGMLIYWLLEKKREDAPGAWQNRLLVFSGVLCLWLAVPVILHVWWNGVIPTWTLPEITLYFIAIAFLIQILVTAIAGILLALGLGSFLNWRQRKKLRAI